MILPKKYALLSRFISKEVDAGFALFYNPCIEKRVTRERSEIMALPETIRKAAKEKAYIRRYGLKLNINTDADIIAHLDKQSSMQGYIKQLIRQDIEAKANAGK